MKKTANRILTAVLALAFCIGSATAAVPAGVTAAPIRPQASLYLNMYTADIWSAGSGIVRIYFDVSGTGIMDEIGSTKILVQRQVVSGWSVVHTYTPATNPEMIDTDTGFHSGLFSYAGVPGDTYRAVVTVYAGKDGGSDSRTITTTTCVA